jgi:hypothetical protein
MPYETDERLKSYLDTNQMHREQMCLAVMAIDKRFSEVRPRHPRGGRDGARDIDAIFNSTQRAFGAVGFVNQASDSDVHKKTIKKKFAGDLSEALKEEPRPEVFVFFTNVNLTLGEKDELIKSAKVLGISHSEVFDRERIRISLDNPDGLSIRFQYLGLPLSEAEQAVFFARWGDDIQGVIADGFGKVQKSLNRILFLQEAGLHLSHFTCEFELDREYSGSEIGHFRAFALVYLKTPPNGLLSFIFGATDNSQMLNASSADMLAQEKSGIAHGMCGAQWDMTISEAEPGSGTELETNSSGNAEEDEVEEKYKISGSFSSVGRKTVKAISIRYYKDSLFRLLPVPRLLDLDECMLIFHLNRTLAQKVQSISIFSNEYKLKGIDAADINIEQPHKKPRVPLLFTETELADPWVVVRPKIVSAFTLHFSDQTPKRFFHADEVSDPRE